MIVTTRAPVRIDFAGGWTDVVDFASDEGGVVVSAALNLYAHAEIRTGGERISLVAEDMLERVSVARPSDLAYDGKLDLHKAAINMLPVAGGIEVLTRTDVPLGSGLGASGALDVALVAGLVRCRDEECDVVELAEMGYELESRELGLLGGRQDQYAAAFGGLYEYTFDGESVSRKKLELDNRAATDLLAHLTVIYSGRSHFSSATHEHVWNAYRARDATVSEALHGMRAAAVSAATAIEAADWKSLARVVDENWSQQRRLHATVSTETTEIIERQCREAGAWAVKATGAGAGGCLLVIAPPENKERVTKAAAAAGGEVLSFEFDWDGVQVWEGSADVDGG